MSLFSIFYWLFDVLIGSTSCEISCSLFLLLLMFFSEFSSLFLSPVSSVLLLFAAVIIFSVSFDFTLSLDFSFPVGYLYFFFGKDNYFVVKID